MPDSASSASGPIPLRALTVRQPWAWAIAAGHKTVENRSWSTFHRGEIAIHAAKRFDPHDLDDARIREALADQITRDAGYYAPEVRHCGYVIAVAELVDVHPDNLWCCAPWGDVRGGLVRHWVLANVRQLSHPVPATGRQGLWTLPDTVAGRIRRGLEATHA